MKLTDTATVSPNLMELKADNSLLDPNFTGYKLSLSSVPVQTHKLHSRVDKVGPAESQYSLQHVSFFATQNLLFVSPWFQSSVYFVDDSWGVWGVDTSPLDGRVSSPWKVWQIPSPEKRATSGRFNVSIVFPSQNLVLVSNGCGDVYLLEMKGDVQSTWTEVYKSTSDSKPTVVLDAVLRHSSTESIEILLMRIEDKAALVEEFKVHHYPNLVKGDNAFLNVIEWQSLVKDPNSSWGVTSKRLLAGRNGIYYSHVEPAGKAIYLASDSAYSYIYDSDNPVVIIPEVPEAVGKPEYLWSQTEDKVTVWFSLSTSCTTDDVQVTIKESSLSVVYKNEEILNGALSLLIEEANSSWNLDCGKLEILLQKVEPNTKWSELIPGNKVGEEILDEETVAAIHSRLAHLCTDKWEDGDGVVVAESFEEQMEECDRYTDELSLFMRFTKGNHNISHQVSLTTHPVLFTIRTAPEKLPAVCMRFQHDGIIWEVEEASDGPKVKHTGTFSALGYVQAGKSQRKYTVCSPDFSYVALCDTTKHIYIYRRPEALENQLKNRKTGEHVKHVATQQVLATDPPVEILGAYASPDLLFVLTTNNLHAYRVKEPTDEL